MARFKSGLPPWLPTPTATDLDVVLEYEGPIVGSFCDGSEIFLFHRTLGDMGRLQVWSYAPITEADLAFLEEDPFDTSKDVQDWANARIRTAARFVSLSWDELVECHGNVEKYQAGPWDAIDHLLDAYQEKTADDLERLRKEPVEVNTEAEAQESMLRVNEARELAASL